MAKKLGIIVSGAKGRMGQAVIAAVREENDLTFVGAVEHAKHADLGLEAAGAKSPKLVDSIKKASSDSPSVVIEFTSPEATLEHLKECVALGIPMVIGTTGLTDKQKKEIEAAAKKIPIVLSPNFSIGVTLLTKVAEDLAARLPDNYDIEIVEMHHRLKKDAPSGTALRLAEALAKGRKRQLKDVQRTTRDGIIGERPKGEIGIQTLRGGDVVGDHTILFAGPGERVQLQHIAHSRDNFARGAVKSAVFLGANKAKSGLYDMFDVLGLTAA